MDRGFEFTLEPLPGLAEVERSWRALEAPGRGSFFTSWAWIGTWLATLPPALPLALVHARLGSRTAGLAVVGRRDCRRRLIIPSRGLYLHAAGSPRWDCITIEHNGFLAVDGLAPAMLDGFIAWFGLGADPADELHLPGLIRPAGDAGLPATLVTARAYAVDLARLSDAGGDVTALLSRNARQQLRRAVRAYEAVGALAVTAARTTGEALDFFAGLKALHISSWERRGKAHAFAHPYFERFHAALIEREFASGAVQFLRIDAGGQVIGYLYNFRRDGRIHAYQSGFADADPRLRPGVVSHCLAIGHNAERGERVYDFMAGDNRLKASFATETYPLYWQVVQKRRLKYRLEAAARRLKQRASAGTPPRNS